MTQRTRASSRLLPRLASELAIIFLGVSAAFVVEDQRQGREERRQVGRLTEALLEHLTVEDSINGTMVRAISDGLETWQDRSNRGERPVPYTYRIPGALRPPVGVWEAVSESEAAELLDPRLLLQLANYYNEIYGTADRFVPHNSFAEFEILPRIDDGPEAFYDDSGRLAPEYSGYMDRLREMARDIERNRASNRELQAALRAVLAG